VSNLIVKVDKKSFAPTFRKVGDVLDTLDFPDDDPCKWLVFELLIDTIHGGPNSSIELNITNQQIRITAKWQKKKKKKK
jgi:hypothetical protein